ncbi:ABC transporter ATP-binding protein [Uliginosibacterium sediminicola]|uniref:ABC transporter ATP-binding protein n=1 Tax=Uliginosibacterium sediminicola TaxID=2024550 RepID=A0ABU9YYM5_9RHOO
MSSAVNPQNTTLASVRDLSVRFRSAQGTVSAVNGVSFDIAPGEVLGLIGESGSGKSVTLRALMKLLPEDRTTIDGSIIVGGRNIMALSRSLLSDYRGGTTAMIFQDPSLALDPVYTIGQQIEEAIRRHTKASRSEARAQAQEYLELVKIPSAAERLKSYPHEMSGGMRQRAMIALALSCKPKLILADEPTTALDATVQIQVLLLLRELQQKMGTSAIFVTHDLGVAAEICDRIAVMYAGRIVEIGSAREVLRAPQHPYTQALMASTIHGSMRGQRITGIAGAPPDLAHLPAGCAFRERCTRAAAGCEQSVPVLQPHAAQAVACFHPGAAPVSAVASL